MSSGVRVRVTGCLSRIDSTRLDSSAGTGVHSVLHTVSRVRDVNSDYCGLTHAVGHGKRGGRRFATGRGRGVRRVFGLMSRSLARVGFVFTRSHRDVGVGRACGVRARVGGFHARLEGRGLSSISGRLCACNMNALCVSVVRRYRGLNSCIIGMTRTHVKAETSTWLTFQCGAGGPGNGGDEEKSVN